MGFQDYFPIGYIMAILEYIFKQITLLLPANETRNGEKGSVRRLEDWDQPINIQH